MRLYTRKQRKVAYLYIDFTFQGKRYRKPLGLEDTPKNRKIAKTKIIPEIQVKLNSGAFIENENKVPTLDQYKIESFEMHKGTRKQSTQNDYRISYDKHISPHLGSMKLDQIKPSHIAKWQSKILESISARRSRNIRAVLSGILQDAVRDEIIPNNPVSLVKIAKVEKVDITPFSQDEIFTILDNAEGQFKNFFALAFFTGMRSGEMIGLKWSDVSFTRGEIDISRAIRMGEVSTTKTVSSKRVIDIIDALMPYIKDQKRLTGNSEYVFINDDGEHFYDIKRIRDTHWKRTLKKCELKYRPIYHTRHTFATIMLENGEDILWVSNMLGHTDATMTLSKYARYIKRDNKNRGSFLEKSVAQNGTNLTLLKNKVA